MERRKFSREFKLEAVMLVRDRGVSMAQAARDLDVHTNVLRKWVREAVSDPGSAFPGHGTMKPEQQEIERLRRELARMKTERDILKKRRPTSRRTRYEVRLRREAPGDLAGIMDMRDPWRFAQRRSRMAGSSTKRSFAQQCRAWGKGPRQLHLQLPNLWRTPRLARSSGRRPVLRSSPCRATDAASRAEGAPASSRSTQG